VRNVIHAAPYAFIKRRRLKGIIDDPDTVHLRLVQGKQSIQPGAEADLEDTEGFIAAWDPFRELFPDVMKAGVNENMHGFGHGTESGMIMFVQVRPVNGIGTIPRRYDLKNIRINFQGNQDY
jgi:hypothetical protein